MFFSFEICEQVTHPIFVGRVEAGAKFFPTKVRQDSGDGWEFYFPKLKLAFMVDGMNECDIIP